jgi:ribonuclease HI
MVLFAHTDGASRGNPGESGIGVILRNPQGEVILAEGGFVGVTTNNVAEYQALIYCLKKAAELGCTELIVRSDSELMVRQMTGAYRVKNAGLREYYNRAQSLIRSGKLRFSIHHVDREDNRDADLLANAGIDTKKPLVV